MGTVTMHRMTASFSGMISYLTRRRDPSTSGVEVIDNTEISLDGDCVQPYVEQPQVVYNIFNSRSVALFRDRLLSEAARWPESYQRFVTDAAIEQPGYFLLVGQEEDSERLVALIEYHVDHEKRTVVIGAFECFNADRRTMIYDTFHRSHLNVGYQVTDPVGMTESLTIK